MPWCKNPENYTKEEKEIAEYIGNLDEDRNMRYLDNIEGDYELIIKLLEENCKKMI